MIVSIPHCKPWTIWDSLGMGYVFTSCISSVTVECVVSKAGAGPWMSHEINGAAGP